MARWLSFFAEYNFVVHYKSGSTNIIADALSRRPDYDLRENNPVPASMYTDKDDCVACATLRANALAVSTVNPLRVEIADAYERDEFYLPIVRYRRAPSDDTLRSLSSYRSRVFLKIASYPCIK